MLTRFCKAPIQNTLLLLVIALHCFFVFILLISPAFAFEKKERKPLIVKTIALKPAVKTIATEKKPTPPKTPQSAAVKPVQNPTPPPKKKEVSKPVDSQKKDPVSKPAPIVKKAPAIADKQLSKSKPIPAKTTPPPQNRAKISDALLQQLEESIAKIESKSDKGVANKKIPVNSKALAPVILQIDTPSFELSSLEDEQNDYTNTLVNHLHQCLSLPDYGEVKIQLSLRQDGTVAKVIVLKAQSEKNKSYLETNLPRLRFPRFDGAYINKKEFTFTLTFCNEH